MKKLVLIVGLVSLAACNKAAAPEPKGTEAAAPAATGAWKLTYPDGTTGITVTNAAGKYFHTKGPFQTGTLKQEGGKSCFYEEGNAKPACVTVKEETDGTFTLVGDDGAKYTSIKLD